MLIRWRLPVVALLLVEIGTYYWLAGGVPLPATPFSLGTALFTLLVGLLPALFNPAPVSILAACFAILMACTVVVPPNTLINPFPYAVSDPVIIPNIITWRLVNAAGIAPAALHLATRLGRQREPFGINILWFYAASLVMLVLMLTIPTGWSGLLVRNLFALLLLCQIGLAVWQFWRTSRQTATEVSYTALQSRILLFFVVISLTPLAVRLAGLALEIELVPYHVVLGGLVIFPAGVAYTILRHNLFGIDSVIRRAFGYTALLLVFLTVYFTATLLLATLLRQAWDQFHGLALGLGLVLAAAVFEPLHTCIQKQVDQWLFPERVRFQENISAAQTVIARVVKREEVIRLLEEDLPAWLGAGWAYLAPGVLPQPPQAPDLEQAWNAALMVGGNCLGGYWLGRRITGQPYDKREQAQLHALLQQAALALAYAVTIDSLENLNRDLEQRIEERTNQLQDQQRDLAAFTERQRLARELHDSVSQTLFNISLSARVIRSLVRHNLQQAVNELETLENSAQDAQKEMRLLLTHLRSPMTPEEETPASLDLAHMLAEYCNSLASLPGRNGLSPLLEVQCHTPASVLLPAALASELFQVAREALHNSAKHSGINKAWCVISLNGNWLEMRIGDHGKGFDPSRQGNGNGLKSMRERITGTLNGQISIKSEPGKGTEVIVSAPLSKE